MNRKNKNIRKILSCCIIVSMVITAFATMITIQAPSIKADKIMCGSEPTIRIYGEQDAVYPTHSYYGETDFIYPKEHDPFDPGIIEKDSITFNPAFWYGHDEYEIKARGDASEKIFLRAFYEPDYGHAIDKKMGGCDLIDLKPVGPFDAIVTETTYFLTTLDDRLPTWGLANKIRFAFPYKSSDPTNPGMEEAGLLDVTYVDGQGTSKRTDGIIDVEKTFEFDNIDYTQDLELEFMDHRIIVRNFEEHGPGDDQIDIEVFYIGNMNDEAMSPKLQTVQEDSFGIGPLYNHYFDRDNNKAGKSDPCHRWYLRIENADVDYLRIALGRRLVAGETFYVDGVRYDMPAVYVYMRKIGEDTWRHEFKYITLQTPIPKGDIIWEPVLKENVHDWSHVSSQYLASLPICESAWLLPPFNDYHVMIDDIGFSNYCTPPIGGLILSGERDPLDIHYVDEDREERFESSLMERLHTEETEEWYWYNVYTKPNRYTEFQLPDQETTADDYEDSYLDVDGFEYLITTSLIAPNSNVDTDRSDSCKSYNEHEIFDRVREIALYDERDDYYEMPRFVFEFDAYNDIDFFINEDQGPSVRIYGEEGFEYPTQSYTGTKDFIYEKEKDPFDPGVILKDSITFNPAFWYGHGKYEIKASGDASEKIFLRAFYEPGYTHPVDALMDGCSDIYLKPVEQFDAVVTETTYFLTTLDDRQPTVGYPEPHYTRVVLPYSSNDADNPGMEEEGLLTVLDTDNMNTMQLTDGSVSVQKEFIFPNDEPYIGEEIQFMDHMIKVINYEKLDPDVDKLDIRFYYTGNMDNAVPSMRTYSIPVDLWGKDYIWFDRDNNYEFYTDACHRWYMFINNADEDFLHVTLGRKLVAGETFYVDGVRYDMPAIYVDNTEGEGFKYITFQSPIPKGSPKWDSSKLNRNIDDFSHVTSQYLARLEMNTPAWLLPPFNENHIMIDDIGLKKDNDHSGSNCLPAAGLILENEKGPLDFRYIEEETEERFESSLVERLHITPRNEEAWYWYNVYTKPNRFTEFTISDQETTSDSYDPYDLMQYQYGESYADGFEYLITTSLIAPNSELNTDRSDSCKSYNEHEIFTMKPLDNNGVSESAQICMVLDGSGSILSGNWDIITKGLADAVRNKYIPLGVELTVIQFGIGLSATTNVEIPPTVLSNSNYLIIANAIETIKYGDGWATPLGDGIAEAEKQLDINNHLYDRQIVNIVTDGAPNMGSPDGETAAKNARNDLINNLNFDSNDDEIDVEAIGSGLTQITYEWLRDNICYPQPGYTNWPPTDSGWIHRIVDYKDFARAIMEKFEFIFYKYYPRFTYEFDADDGTGLYINNGGDDLQPPICDICEIPVIDKNCEEPVPFDGSCSYDPDGYIVQYYWDFGDGNTGTGKTITHSYSSEGTYTVTLTCTDNDGLTCTDTTQVTIICEPDGDEKGIIEISDIYLDCEGGRSAYLNASDFDQDIGMATISICYDSTKLQYISADSSEFNTMYDYDFPAIGKVTISGIMTQPNKCLTGDFVIARLIFTRKGDGGCPLTICESTINECSTSDPIPHTTIDGYAYDQCGGTGGDEVLGDMNDDGILDMKDVRYLAIYILSGGTDPDYSPLYADGNVDSQGVVDMADVRYLAIYILSGGTDPDYSPLYPTI